MLLFGNMLAGHGHGHAGITMPVLTEYTCGTSGYDLLRLTQMKTGNNHIAWTYDSYGRPLTEKRNVDGAGLLEFSFTYGSNGQLETTVCPEGLRISNEYDPYGNLIQVSADARSVWMLLSASGSTTSSLLNGFMVATATQNSRGMLSNLKTMSAPDIIPGATTVRNMDFVFNETTGNLTSRTGMIPRKETFYYDNLDRLTDVKHGSPETSAMSVGYAANGNITSKTGLGIYSYNASKVHALEEVDNTDGLVPEGDQAITYNAFNRVSQITETVDGELRQLNITYGPDGQRWKTELRKNGNLVKTVIFAGDYERVIKSDTTTHLYYMEGGGIHVKQVKGASTLLREGRYYIHPDHLGSLTLITDATGGTVQKCSFDAWGKRTFITKTPSLVFDRGFTGHEHLDEFGLINMNGRMYDPVVGRFLSPDPYVQDPEFSQSFNRYSYCWNNPLIYTDPTGEVFGIDDAIFIVAMAYFSGMQANFWHAANNGGNPFNPGDWNWKSPWTYTSIAAGAFSAYAQTLQHCEYMIDLGTGEKFFYSHNGDGVVNILNYGHWVDNHTAFKVSQTVIRDVALGGVDNIQKIATSAHVAHQGSNIIAARQHQSRHEQIMSNPTVQKMHGKQAEFLYGEAAMFVYSFLPVGGAAAKALGGISKIAKPVAKVATKGRGRVFWSGEGALNTAMNYAKSTGGTTLEMTTKGGIMNTLNPILPRSISNPIWRNLSTNFAKGAIGEAHFFTSHLGPRPGSIWLNIEKPILEQNGIRIITH
ncbi:MAG: hypothetical protein LBL04_03205 [Bacteroidales bacterium]|jgi:RHS repeat-associated protein|nr:hypothetical protein [Bacteroidales bacterium]